MPKFTLKQNLSIDGKFYGFGSVVELTDAQAKKFADIVTEASGSAKVSAPGSADLTKAPPAEDGDSDNEPADLSKLNKAQLTELLASKGAEVDPNASKAQLLEQLSALK